MVGTIEYENLREANEPFFEEYKRVFAQTLERGWFILGSSVEAFEREFAAYLGARHCVGVASGLDALVLSLRVLGLPAGSEVIVPSNTYIATILAVLHCGLKPVLVEPDIRTYNLDPTLVEKKIGPQTRVVMPVHLYGKPCDMDPIVQLCRERGLYLIEDCAQAHGARYKGRMVGTFGIGAFSFYPTKNLGALGDGGAVVTDDAAIAELLRKYRNYGSAKKYYNEVVGYNSRLDEVQAGFLRVKLQHLDEINEHKRRLARIYLEGLREDFIKPVVDDRTYDVYHIFNVRHPRRDALREYLLRNGIKTDIHYPVAPSRQQALQGLLDEYEFPLADEIHRTTLSLPISFCHNEQQIRRVVDVMNAFPG